MNSTPNAANPPPRRTAVFLTVALALVCAAVGLIWWKFHRPEQATGPDSAVAAAASQPVEEGLPQLVDQPTAAAEETKPSVASIRPRNAVAATSPPPTAARPEPSPASRQLINNLFRLDQPGVPQTKEQIAEWKANLQQLVGQGGGAVSAIAEFLEKNVDLSFGREGSQALGYSSARAALFDVLTQIGGPDAVSLLGQTLQATADPREIAMIARSLEQLEPQQHQAEMLEAARQVLAMAAAGKANETEVGPLFEVLQKYGGPAAVAELVQATGNWNYYSAIALGQLPEGAGVAALVQIVTDPNSKSKGVAALEMLTQVAGQYPEARAALLEQARANKIAPAYWPYLASVLAGDQLQLRDSALEPGAPPPGAKEVKTFHITSGNQNFYSAPPNALTAEQIQQQIALVDELIAVTSNPIGVQTLQNARNTLLRRMPPPTSGAGN